MKALIGLLVVALAVFRAGAALAHSMEEHMSEAEMPDCKAMEGMDLSRMDRDDPVVQAMMKQCMKEMHGEHPETEPAAKDPQKGEKSDNERRHEGAGHAH